MDILTYYGVKKRTASAAKTVKYGSDAEHISTVKPEQVIFCILNNGPWFKEVWGKFQKPKMFIFLWTEADLGFQLGEGVSIEKILALFLIILVFF